MHRTHCSSCSESPLSLNQSVGAAALLLERFHVDASACVKLHVAARNRHDTLLQRCHVDKRVVVFLVCVQRQDRSVHRLTLVLPLMAWLLLGRQERTVAVSETRQKARDAALQDAQTTDSSAVTSTVPALTWSSRQHKLPTATPPVDRMPARRSRHWPV